MSAWLVLEAGNDAVFTGVLPTAPGQLLLQLRSLIWGLNGLRIRWPVDTLMIELINIHTQRSQQADAQDDG